jgi:DNA-binding transcriptional ArsR family regulator
VHALDILGDPVRRRLLELLADGERTAGELTEVIRGEFGISQPAVSNHLKVLRDNGFASSRREASWQIYQLLPDRLAEADAWLHRYRKFWTSRLDALSTELARGRHDTRSQPSGPHRQRKGT